MSSVSAMAVLDLHDMLLDAKVVSRAQLTQARLDRQTLVNVQSSSEHPQEKRIDESKLLALWALAAANEKNPELGLLIGLQFNPSAKGLLANWISQCTSLDEAMSIFQKHIVLMNPSENWQRTEHDDFIELSFEFAADKSYPQMAIERSMSALLTWARILSGEVLAPISCQFSFNQPAYVDSFYDIFGPNIIFEQNINSIKLEKGIFQRAIDSANPYLKQVIAERGKLNFLQLQQASSLSDKVRSVIREDLQTYSDVDAVCQRLCTSRATLYRRLKSENTSFTNLLNQTRKDIAGHQVKQGVAISRISQNLGFKDTSTFYKAFKRWFGMSPGKYSG